jgi:hypothetical protein
MRTKQTVNVLRRIAFGLLGSLFLGGFAAWSAQPTPDKGSVMLGTNTIPQSVFLDDARGKDPFFPNSTRRQQRAIVPDSKPVIGPASLVVLGITGTKDKPRALINNQDFLVGEEWRVKVPGGTSLVKCVEIRERSVVVTIQGGTEQFEIQYEDRTLPIAPRSGGEE